MALENAQVARELATGIISRWRRGERPGVQRVLREHPDLLRYKTIVLDLAYEEYCLRREARLPVDLSTLCHGFSTHRESFMRLLEVHKYAESTADLTSPFDPHGWPSPGGDFLGFRIREELGRGAFARVFLANELALGNRAVALKVSRLGNREAHTLGKLSHPNIVPVYSVQDDVASRLTAVCMPFLGSTTLRDVLDTLFGEGRPAPRGSAIIRMAREGHKRISGTAPSPGVPAFFLGRSYVEEVVQIGAQLAEALAYTHSEGILHRDLKPSNVLLTPAGIPMLLDFNLSTDQSSEASRIGGTLPYMPPEQIRAVFHQSSGTRNENDPRSDVFSLGVVLYELLTGSLPFGNLPLDAPTEQVVETLLSRQSKGAPPLRDAIAQADGALAQAVHQCLDPNPDKRPRSAAELAKSLQQWLSTRRRLSRWVWMHRRGALVLCAAACVALGSPLWYFATRDSYGVRQFRSGVDEYRNGNLRQALIHFDEALAAGLDAADVHFARGQTGRALGNLQAATEDYLAAARGSDATIIKECLGYCFAKRGYHNDAAHWYEEIPESARTAAVCNNLGYSYMRNNKLDRAEPLLERAKELDDSAQAAFHNSAKVALREAEQGDLSRLSAGIEDIQRAINIGPATGQHYYDAACLYAIAAKKNPAQRASALKYVELAVAHGEPQASFRENDFEFAQFFGDPAFETILRGAPATRGYTRAELLIPPSNTMRLP